MDDDYDDGIPFEGIVWGVLLSIPMWVVAGVFTWLLLRRRQHPR